MQATTDCSSPHVSSPSPAAELPEGSHAAEKAPERAPKESPGTSPRRPSNAFTDSFLVRARRLVPFHDGKSFLGHLARPEPGLLPRLHALRSIQANPDALAQVLESLGPEGLALLGRALARRVDGVG